MTDQADTRSLAMQARLHRELGGTGRLLLALELSEFTRSLTVAGLRDRFPTASDDERKRKLMTVLNNAVPLHLP